MATISTPGTGGPSTATPGFPSGAKAITTSDTDVFSEPVNVYVGVTGDVAVRPAHGGSAVTFKNMQAGSMLPVRVLGVNATNTTATNLVAVY